MRFSDWQLHRLRDALGAYHDYGRDPVDGRFYNWKDVSEAISESTGVEVPQERLRQFVEGVRTPEGVRKYPAPQTASLDAIVAFATDEDNDLLSEKELEEFAPPRQAAMRLLEYLDQALERTLPPATLEGTYWSRRTEGGNVIIREITLQHASDDGLIQLTQVEDTYRPEAVSLYENDWSPQQRAKVRKSRIVYGGWGILTPEDNLLMFLKHEHNGRNRYYLTVTSELSMHRGTPVMGLTLLHHDFPLEVEEGAPLEVKNMDTIIAAVGENIMPFSRVE
jgi:hypothetical protein